MWKSCNSFLSPFKKLDHSVMLITLYKKIIIISLYIYFIKLLDLYGILHFLFNQQKYYVQCLDNDYYYGEKCKSRFPVYQSKYLLGPYFVSVWQLPTYIESSQIPCQLSKILKSVTNRREEFIKIQQSAGFQNEVHSSGSKPA